jgi:hypothetical protein
MAMMTCNRRCRIAVDQLPGSRPQTNFLSEINAIPPVQSAREKYSASTFR